MDVPAAAACPVGVCAGRARVRVRDGLLGALPEPVTSGEGLGRARAETSVAEAAGLGR